MPRAGLSPDAVVDLALAVVDDGGPRGYEDLTLAAVAARAGVAVPSLYKHVAGLPALRREVARVCIDDFTAELERARDRDADGPDALRAMAAAVRSYAHRFPGRYAAVQGAGWRDDPDALAVREAGARSVRVISDALAAAGADTSVDAVRSFRAALHGFVRLELDGGFGMPDDVDASFDHLVVLMVHGLTR